MAHAKQPTTGSFQISYKRRNRMTVYTKLLSRTEMRIISTYQLKSDTLFRTLSPRATPQATRSNSPLSTAEEASAVAAPLSAPSSVMSCIKSSFNARRLGSLGVAARRALISSSWACVSDILLVVLRVLRASPLGLSDTRYDLSNLLKNQAVIKVPQFRKGETKRKERNTDTSNHEP